MKKTVLIFLSLLIGVSVYAAEFKNGEAKYQELPDGTVELKEFKKATGEVVIPEKVTNPKGGKEYLVTAIGKEAFKKAPLTSVVIPSTIKSIGDEAFKECKNLAKVEFPKNITDIPFGCFRDCKSLTSFDFEGKRTIGGSAFNGTGLTHITIPPSVSKIGNHAFGRCDNLKLVQIEYSEYPLEMHTGVMYGTPVETVYLFRNLNYPKNDSMFDKFKLYNNNGALKELWISPNINIQETDNYLVDSPNATVIFTDENAGEQAVNLLASLSPNINSLANTYFVVKDHHVTRDNFGNTRPFKRVVTSEADNNKRNNVNYPIAPNKFYFGVKESENGYSTIQENPVEIIDAFEVAYDNADKEKFLWKMQKFISTAVEDPAHLQNVYREIEPKEAVKYNDIMTNTYRVLLDSVYLVKPTLTKDELENLYGFIKNIIMSIGADYGVKNCHLEEWAKKDILTKDLASGDHKEDYERLLKAAERYFYHLDKKDNDEDFLMAMQLASLCGLERWKDAANYFPKFIQVYTNYGKRNVSGVPYEIKYIQQAINNHGYKAVIPDFSKRKKRAAASSSKDDGSAFEFFMNAAINAGIERYREKKAEKRARELYYESLGLDKKGRPKKK